MRLSASRIRSINRAIARFQSSAWFVPVRIPHRTLANAALAVSVNTAEFVKVVLVPETATVERWLSTSNTAMNAAGDRCNSKVGVLILLPLSYTQAR